MEHNDLVELARKHFTKTPVWSEDSGLIDKSIKRDLSVAQYTGGRIEVSLKLNTRGFN